MQTLEQRRKLQPVDKEFRKYKARLEDDDWEACGMDYDEYHAMKRLEDDELEAYEEYKQHDMERLGVDDWKKIGTLLRRIHVRVREINFVLT